MYQYQTDFGDHTVYNWDNGDTVTITVPTDDSYYQNLVWDYSSDYSTNYWSVPLTTWGTAAPGGQDGSSWSDSSLIVQSSIIETAISTAPSQETYSAQSTPSEDDPYATALGYGAVASQFQLFNLGSNTIPTASSTVVSSIDPLWKSEAAPTANGEPTLQFIAVNGRNNDPASFSGHMIVQLNYGNGQQITFGFYPGSGVAGLIGLNSGEVKDDAKRAKDASDYNQTIGNPNDPSQAAAFTSQTISIAQDKIAVIENILLDYQNNKNWSANLSCVNLAQDVLTVSGATYQAPDGTQKPQILYNLFSVEQVNNMKFVGEYLRSVHDNAYHLSQPLIVDLDGDGVEFTEYLDSTVFFDVDGDGQIERTAWAGVDDGLLVVDLDGNGLIDQPSEVVLTRNAVGATSDLDAVRLVFDSNQDGVFNAADSSWSSFRVWHDANQNGVSETGELQTLASMGIERLELSSTPASGLTTANEVKGLTLLVKQDGSTLSVADAGLQYVDVGLTPISQTSEGIVAKDALGKMYLIARTENNLDLNAKTLGLDGIYGQGGIDYLKAGGNAAVVLYGAQGNDVLEGGGSIDYLFGGDGDDIIRGEAEQTAGALISSDLLKGDAGNDMLIGDSGTRLEGVGAQDALFGDAGNDTQIGDAIEVQGIGGNDYLDGGDGDDILYGDAVGLVGLAGCDTMVGGNGNDTLIGDAWRVTIRPPSVATAESAAATGSDTLFGGAGSDTLYGGVGNDVAVYRGNRADYEIINRGAFVTVRDLRDEATMVDFDGTDTLTGVETLRFADGDVAIDANAAPVAVVDDLAGTVRGTMVITSGELLANDFDLEGDALSIIGVGKALHGSVSIDEQGRILFTPEAGYTGKGGFTYTVSDGKGGIATARASLTIQQALPDDPLYAKQWHLQAINAPAAWEDYTGAGVLVGNLDGAAEYTHPDLVANYDTTRDYDFTTGDNDPIATAIDDQKHATSVLGIIAASRNDIGGVGVAYGATVVEYENSVADTVNEESAANITTFQHLTGLDVANIIGTYGDPLGKVVSVNKFSWLDAAYQNAAAIGRNGLGTVMVVTGGNQNDEGNLATLDDTVNSRFVIGAGVIEEDGKHSFSTPGASIFVVAPGVNLYTTDRTGNEGYDAGDNPDYTLFAGTCGSAPVVSGVAALILEANPNLGWRDVQEIIAYSARQTDSSSSSWFYNAAGNWNGGGFHVSDNYGFGLINARAATRLAETWQGQHTSANEASVGASSGVLNAAITDSGVITNSLAVSSNLQIDHVEVDLSIDHARLGDLIVTLISPDGTQSILVDRTGVLREGEGDHGLGEGAGNLTITTSSNQFWGETGNGTWTLEVTDAVTGETGTLNNWGLRLYGDTTSNDSVYIYSNEFSNYTNAGDVARHTLSDGIGTDTINASMVTADQVIDLRADATSYIAGNVVTLGAGTVIEKAYAGDGNDILIGNGSDNLLWGGRGDDTLVGGAGTDTLNGGTGIDLVSYAASELGVTADLSTGLGTGGDAEGDLLIGIENLTGSGNADLLVGDGLDNKLSGCLGNDVLLAGAGNDALLGDEGDDTLSGAAGDDTLWGGAGNDILHGGEGTDIALFQGYESNYVIDLQIAFATITGADGVDVLDGIEMLRFADKDVWITAQNAAPTVGADTVGTNEDAAITISLASLLANDTDSDSDPLSVISVGNPSNGSVEITETSVIFRPTAEFSGVGGFDYTVDDGKGGIVTTSVAVNVSAVNDNPEGSAGQVVMTSGGQAFGKLTGTDIDSPVSAFTYSLNQQAAHGVVTINADGTYTYTAAAGYVGQDSFTFAVADGSGGTGTGTMSVQVRGAPKFDQIIQVNARESKSAGEHDWTLGPKITTLANGDLIVVYPRVMHENDTELYAQRFDQGGNAIGSEFHINQFSYAWQDIANVIPIPDGGFLVSWSSFAKDGSGYAVVARRYDAYGVSVGDEFVINETTEGSQRRSSALVLDDGSLIFSWESNKQDGSGYGVYGRHFSADGKPLGNEFQINSYAESWQHFPQLCKLGNGGFVSVWMSEGQDEGGYGIFGQLFDVVGNRNGSEFQLNEATGLTSFRLSQIYPRISALSDGGFIAIWQDGDNVPSPGKNWDITARRYTSQGLAASSEIRVNIDDYISSQVEPAITVLSDGNWLAVWASENGNMLRGQKFDLDGNALQPSFDVSPLPLSSDYSTLSGPNFSPQVTALPEGGFAVTWLSHDELTSALDISLKVYGGAVGHENAQICYSSGDGSDALFGGVGGDSLSGGRGDDYVSGNEGNDTLSGGVGNDHLFGGLGDDIFRFSKGEGVDYVSDTGSGSGDRIILGPGIGAEEITITRTANNELEINYDGTGSKIVLASQFQDTAQQIEIVEFSDGTIWNLSGPLTFAVDDNFSTTEDSSLQISADDLIQNDKDAEGNNLAITSVGSAAHGVVHLDTNGSVIFTPDSNFNGSASFEYTISDGTAGVDSAKVLIDVIARNDAPLAVHDTYVTMVDTAISASADQGLLSNDSDVDGDRIVATGITTSNQGGAVAIASDGSFTYTPLAGFLGEDTFTYQISDGNGGFSSTTASIDVRAYSAAYHEIAGFMNAPIIGNLWDNGLDNLRFNLLGAAKFGSAQIARDGTYTYTPLAGFTGVDQFTYRVTASNGQTSTNTVDVSVLVPESPSLEQFAASLGDYYNSEAQIVSLGDGSSIVAWNGGGRHFDANGKYLSEVGSLANGSMSKSQSGGYLLTSVSSIYGNQRVVTREYDTNGLLLHTWESSVSSRPLLDSASSSLIGGGCVVVTVDCQSVGMVVCAQQFNAEGAPLGDKFRVSSTTGTGGIYSYVDGVLVPGGFTQVDPKVTYLLDGGYFITWRAWPGGWSADELYGQRFNAQGAMVGSAIKFASNDPSASYVTCLSNGNLLVTWNQNGAARGQIVTPSGSAIGSAIQITGMNLSAVALADGNFVMAWQNGGDIFGQKYSMYGIPLGNIFLVNSFAEGDQSSPSISSTTDGGFVVAWQSANQDGSGSGIFWKRFDAYGVATGLDFSGGIGNDIIFGDGTANQLSGEGGDDTLHGCAGNDTLDGGQGIDVAEYKGRWNDFNISRNPDGTVQVTDLNTLDGNDGSDILSSIEYLRFDDVLLASGVEGFVPVDLAPIAHDINLILPVAARVGGKRISSDTNNATENYIYSLVPSYSIGTAYISMNGSFSYQAYRQGVGGFDFLVTDQAGLSSRGHVNVNVYGTGAVASARQVNTQNIGNQITPSMALLASGGYIVVWQSEGQAGPSASGVHGQIYNADGMAVGEQFKVNRNTQGSQKMNPSVSGFANGGFVVVWGSPYAGLPNSRGVFGQIYDENGNAIGQEFKVDSSQANPIQDNPTVTSLRNGGYVVSWSSPYEDGSGLAVFGQCYNVFGGPVGQKFQINTYTTNNQGLPSIASLQDGGFVATWQSNSQDGSGAGIFGQRFDENGSAVGQEFKINTFTLNNQVSPSVASLRDGGFVAIWSSWDQGGAGCGLYGQRFDVNGVAVGGEFNVCLLQAPYPFPISEIVGLSDGGFVVSWYDNQQYSFVGQRYDATGARNGENFIIAEGSGSDGAGISLMGLPNGGYAASWTGWDNSQLGIFLQKYDQNGNPQNGITLVGGNGSDIIVGNAADNLILSRDGDDTLVGGIGNDYLSGAVGNDVYLFNLGNGSDMIEDMGDAGGTDTLRFGSGILASGVSVTRDEANLYLALSNGVGNVTVRGHFSGLSLNSIERIEYADGTAWDLTAPLAFATTDKLAATEDNPLIVSPDLLLSNDIDFGDGVLTLTSVGTASHGAVTFDQNGQIIFTPEANFIGTAGFDYSILGNSGASATGHVDITLASVNDEPICSTIAVLESSEDTSLTIMPQTLLAGAADVDGDSLTVASVGNATHGVVVFDTEGNVVFTPEADYNGQASFDYTISDGNGGMVTATATANVAAVNDAPVSGTVAEQAISEDTALTVLASTLQAGASDIDSAALTLASVGNAIHGTVALDQDGNVVFTPEANYNGQASFDYTISDGQGGTVTATAMVNVGAVNDAPIASAFSMVGTEDAALTILTSSLLTQASDVDGDALTMASVGNATHGTVALDIDGNVVFTPDADYNGMAIFDYTVSDGSGGTATATASINLVAVNDAPTVGAAAAQATDEDTSLTVLAATMLAGATDIDGDALTISSVGNATHGAVALVQDGNVVFTPDANYNGQASFDYTVSDGHGGTATSTASVSVGAVNDAPVATIYSASATEDTVLTVLASDLVATGSDADGDVLSLTSVGNAVNGTVALDQDGNVVFTPDADYNGAASFDYTISDGHGGTATATASVNVAAVNDAPVAGTVAAQVASEDASITVLTSSLLASASDIDGDALTLSSAGNASHGAVALDQDGNVVFTPMADYNGVASFDYTISDGHGGTVTATATVDVAPVNDDPVAQTGGQILLGQGQSVSSQLKASDIDDAVSALTYSLVAGPAHGALTLNADGSYSYQAVGGYSGSDSFTWKVTDASGAESISSTGVTIGAQGNWGHADQVNTYVTNNQTRPNIATLANGNSILSWTSYGQDGSVEGVFGQLIGQDGRSFGPEFSLTDTTVNIQRNPTLASFADGGFVAAWESSQDGSGTGIYCRLFNADGTPSTGELQINTTTSSTQSDANLAVSGDGNFMVTWGSYGQDGGLWGVYGRLYNRSGAALTDELQVNQCTNDSQYTPRISALANGGFVVTWTSNLQDGSSTGVYARIYNASGQAAGNEFQVNIDTAYSQSTPTIATLSDGSFVIMFYDGDSLQTPSGSGDITGRRFAVDGTPMSGEFRINISDFSGIQNNTCIAALSDGGFIAVWETIDSGFTYANAIRAQRFDASGNLTESYTVATMPYDSAGIGKYLPKVAAREDGGFTVTWGAKGADGSYDVFEKTYAAQDITTAQTASTVTADIQAHISMLGLAGGGYWATWSSYNQDGSSYGVYSQRFDAAGAKVGGEFLLNTTTLYGQYYPVTSQLADGSILAVWNSSIQDGSSGGIFARRFSSDGAALTGEFQVNSYTAGDQLKPSVTALADGGFFVTWHSQGQDGSGYGVYGQRFDANGSKVGAEAQINSYTAGDQYAPVVESLANGGYVVTWASYGQDAASTYGTYARVYDASGNAVTGEFQVNVGTAGTQYSPAVTELADGSFVIAWYDSASTLAPTSGTDITARRFAADGTALTGEFRINLANVVNNQYKPTIVALSNGGFVAAWYTYSGSAFNAIMAQRFDANGTAGESYTVATQAYNNAADQTPSITALADGGFAVGWQAYGPDGSYDVYTKAYHGWAKDFAPQTLTGGASDDVIQGGDANDTLSGLGGADTLLGNTGTDFLSGGTGNDLYMFNLGDGTDTISDSGNGIDTITFGSGIGHTSLHLVRAANDLVIEYGTSGDSITIKDHFGLNKDSGQIEAASFQDGTSFNLTDLQPVAIQDSLTVIEDETVVIGATTLLQNDIVKTDNTLSLSSVGNATHGTVTLDANGNVVFTPDADFNGTASFDYTISDGNGGTAAAMATVDVAAVNDAPTPNVVAAQATNEDASVTILALTLLANTTDVDGDTVTLSSVGNASHGTVGLDQDGNVVFTPDADYNGAASFDYTVEDGHGGTATATASINVAAVNDAPVTGTVAAQAGSEDAPVTILASTLLAGASDIDGDALTLASVGNASHGTVALDGDGNVVFTPAGDFNGVASFDYTVADGHGGTVTATATVNVAPVNDAPMAQTGGQILLGQGQSVSSQLKASDSDDAVSALTYSLVSGPGHGALTLNADGSYSYQAASGYSGSDSFTWKVTDASGAESTASTAVTIAAQGNWGQVDRINTYTTNEQTKPAIATLADGNSLISWTSEGQDGSLAGVYAQVLGEDGRPIGSEFRINATTSNIQRNPTLASFADGGFVAAWESWLQDGSLMGVYARLFNSDGTTVAGEFQINATTADWQYDPSVTALNDGCFVVTWSSNLQDGSNYGIYGRVYDRNGVAQTGEFQINQYTTDWQYESEVSALANGGFVVTWTSGGQDGSSFGTYARVYNADGQAVGNEFQVNTYTTNGQYRPTVTSLDDGSFVILFRDGDSALAPYSSGEISGRRFAADGTPMTGQFRVNLSDFYGSQSYPSVAALSDGGFVAVWETVDSSLTYANAIRAQRFDASGNLTEAYTVATLPYDSAGLYMPKVAARDDGGFTVTWQAKGADGTSDVFTKTYAAQDITATQTASTATADIQAHISMLGLAEGGYWATWSSYNQDGSSYGVYSQRFDAAGAKVGGEFRLNTTTLHGQYYPSTTQLADGSIVVAWTASLQDGNASAVVARRFASDGTALSAEFLVNTYTIGDQYKPNVTALADGGFFIAWHSNGQDGSGFGVYGQRFDALGDKVGAEAQINTYTAGDQSMPVAASLENGNYVVTWHSMGQDAASTYGTYARVYDAGGNAVTGEFQVNVGTAGTQYSPAVTGLADGSFVIAWYDSASTLAPTSGTDITARRFAADGTALTGEFRVNLANVINNQYKPTIASLSDGGFVVAWYTYSGSAFNAIMAQRFAADGTAGESYTVATQAYNNAADQSPSITALSDGGFAVGWQAYGPDGSYDVYTKAYHGWAKDFAPQTLTGGSSDDVIQGGDANDTISGLGGADTLLGGTGADSYLFGRGDGADVVNNQTHGGEGDKLVFGNGIATDQLWFARSGNDLLVSVIGTGDQVNVQDWYASSANHVDSFKTSDGQALLDSQVDNLVSAMAAFSAPGMGQTTLPQNYQDQLAPVFAANWHAG